MTNTNRSRQQSDGVAPSIRERLSPPCWMHDVDPFYLGLWTSNDVLIFMHRLLEIERAALADMEVPIDASCFEGALEIQLAHASCCAVLRRQIGRLGGTSPDPTFAGFLRRAGKRCPEQIIALAHGHQAALAETIEKAILKIFDPELRAMLSAIRQVHLDQTGQLASLFA